MVDVTSATHVSQGNVGKLLYEARKLKGLSLEDVGRDIYIPVEQLEALEREDFSIFSAEVYARGAYTKYADYLGVETNASRLAVLRALSQARKEVYLDLHTPSTWLQHLINPRLIFIFGIILAALVVAGYIVWQVQSFWRLPRLEITSPLSEIVYAEKVVVSGISEPEAHIIVNTEAVLLRDDASFETELYMQPGINVVQIEAENAAGRKKVITRHLLRPRNENVSLQ